MPVEYTDPSRVFPSISEDLSKRLPLRNLHWNSSTRPLRSIKSLHVDLVPDESEPPRLASPTPSQQRLEVPQNGAGDETRDRGKSHKRPASNAGSSYKKERRHQIPGLRQTPYLKIYLLRCEDIDSYKNISRKPLREWVKQHTPQSPKGSKANKQENHDAFEWLILHVINPEDIAVASSNDRKLSSKRDPSQLNEKIRADFNGTSKTAIDRVAQIQTNEGAPGTTPLGQNPQDGDTGWGDLIFKLKSLILASFNLRVQQYEEDLREKESQRSLPGWNFNTFFVLKEGLAIGFESVGLVEDALTSYHELAVGLHSVIEESRAADSSTPSASTLRDYTNELLEELGDALYNPSSVSNGAESGTESPDEAGSPTSLRSDFGFGILDTNRKPYRELILANQISAFDFQCYIFARQLSLLSRLANVAAIDSQASENPKEEDTFDKFDTQSKFGTPFPRPSPEPENLVLFSEICRRAVEFIVYTSSTMREDFGHGAEHLREQHVDAERSRASIGDIVNNLLASWTCSVADQILQRTLTHALSTQLQPLLRQFRPLDKGSRPTPEHAPTQNPFPQQAYPARTSSLSPSASDIVRPPSPVQRPFVASLDAIRLLPPSPAQTGSQELAAQRAELLYLKRNTIVRAGFGCGGWKAGLHKLKGIHNARDDEMQNVSLDKDVPEQDGDVVDSAPAAKVSFRQGLRNAPLRTAIISEDLFLDNYESITALTLSLFILGRRMRTAQAMIADIAATRFQLKDYSAAASYFRQLAPFYAKGEWIDLELVMLNMYARCLKYLERNEEYVSIALKILAKQVQTKEDAPEGPQLGLRLIGFQGPAEVDNSLEDILTVSKSIESEFVVAMEDYFGEFELDPCIRHADLGDGFMLQLRLHHIMREDLLVEEVRICLVSVDDNQQAELWVSKVTPQTWRSGWVKVVLESQVMQPGVFKLDKIAIKAGNITFQHDASLSDANPFQDLPGVASSMDLENAHEEPRIYVYPQPKSFDARAKHSNDIHLDKTRTIEITLSSGRHDVTGGKISIRSGTAGLRLHTADAEALDDQLEMKDKAKPGLLSFRGFAAGTELKFKVPYNLESELKEIDIRLEVTYTTQYGDFAFVCSPKISILLPLGVNVQDIFTKEALFAKFSVFTANGVPLRLLHCTLEGTNDFDIHSPALDSDLDIFSRQPVSIVARITSRKNSSFDRPLQRKVLLQITYACLDEAITNVTSEALTKFLSTTQFSHLTRLVLPTLHSTLLLQDLENAALLRSITLPVYQSESYTAILPAVKRSDQETLLQQLRAFHSTHVAIDIPISTLTAHTLTIPVEIPTLSVLHTASLDIRCTEPTAVNTALPAEVRIRHSRIWGPHADRCDPLDFIYEVSAPPDIWLIGGQRRAQFSANEDEEVTFPLLLLPQRTGHLLYPSVEIRHSPQRLQADEDGSGGRLSETAEETLSCETDYKSQAKTILVVDGLQRTTVVVDHEAAGNGAWVLETKKWGEA